jgi:hypothetical protein
MLTYEQRLDRHPGWALLEGSMHFEGGSAVHQSLRKIVARLEALGIPYAVAGGMALFLHGFRRFTEDVDILVTREDLTKIHQEREGLGYLPPLAGSKNLRDAETGVRIKFLIAGDYPGDGKPKPVAFPNPATVRMETEGMEVLNLPTLIELKLASGMTNPLRLKDVVDVQELIQRRKLPGELAEQLNPFVRGKYLELWTLCQTAPPDRDEG